MFCEKLEFRPVISPLWFESAFENRGLNIGGFVDSCWHWRADVPESLRSILLMRATFRAWLREVLKNAGHESYLFLVVEDVVITAKAMLKNMRIKRKVPIGSPTLLDAGPARETLYVTGQLFERPKCREVFFASPIVI